VGARGPRGAGRVPGPAGSGQRPRARLPASHARLPAGGCARPRRRFTARGVHVHRLDADQLGRELHRQRPLPAVRASGRLAAGARVGRPHLVGGAHRDGRLGRVPRAGHRHDLHVHHRHRHGPGRRADPALVLVADQRVGGDREHGRWTPHRAAALRAARGLGGVRRARAAAGASRAGDPARCRLRHGGRPRHHGVRHGGDLAHGHVPDAARVRWGPGSLLRPCAAGRPRLAASARTHGARAAPGPLDGRVEHGLRRRPRLRRDVRRRRRAAAEVGDGRGIHSGRRSFRRAAGAAACSRGSNREPGMRAVRRGGGHGAGMPRRWRGAAAPAAAVVLALLASGACGPSAPLPTPAPPPVPAAPAAPGVEPSLPPIPPRDEPLSLSVVYPPAGARIATRDSNFIFGSTNTGRARLLINGQPVAVAPNGAFLAFLPVPPDGVYVLEATAGAQTARLEPAVVPPAPDPPSSGAESQARSITPRGAWAALPGERIDVSFRGTAGGQAWLVLPDGTRVPLLELRSGPRQEPSVDPIARPAEVTPGWAEYRGYFAARPLRAADAQLETPIIGSLDSTQGGAGATTTRRGGAAPARIELIVGNDTTRAPLPLNLAIVDPARPPVGIARDPGPPGQTDMVVVARPAPGATSHFFWPNGTELTLTGQRGGELRVRLGRALDAWVPVGEVRLEPPGTPPPVTLV